METMMIDETVIDSYVNIINALPANYRNKVIGKLTKPPDKRSKEEKQRMFKSLVGSFKFDTTPEDLIREIETSRTTSEIKILDF